MKKPPHDKKSSSLREQAETKLKHQADRLEDLSRQDMQKLVHELGTHQIELEMQNEELRRTQQELESSRRKYADLYDFAPIGYFTFDSKGGILELNMAGSLLLAEKGKEKLRNVSFARFIHETDAGGSRRFLGHLDEALESERPAVCELKLKRSDGAMLIARLQSISVRDAGADPHIRTAVSDITLQREAEDLLRENEDRFRLIAETSNDLIFQLDLAGKVVYASPAIGRYGYDPGAVIGTHFAAYLDPRDQAKAQDAFGRAASGSQVDLLELSLRYAAGAFFHAEVNVAPVRRNGVITGVQGACRDITERKRAEEALQRERDLLQAVMNGAKNSHLVYLDREFNFVRVNAAYAETCGYRPEEMIGKNHFALYPHAENEAIFRRVRDTGEPFEVRDKPFVFPDQPERGVTYWDWTLTPVKSVSGAVDGLVFSLHETTERKMAEKRIQHLASFPALNPNPVLEIDRSGKVTFANDTTRSVLRDQGLEDTDASRFLPGNLDVVLERLGQGEGGTFEREVRMGRRTFAETLYLTPQFGTVRIYGYDITERKAFEAALTEREEQLRLFIEHAPVSLAMFDREMRYLSVSLRWMSEYGLGDRGIIGRSHYDVFPETPERWKEAHQRGLAGEVVKIAADRFERQDGSVQWLSWEIRPWHNAEGIVGGIVIFTDDITERKKAEEALQQHMEEMRRANEELERFNRVAVGRELRMIELKREINALCADAGLPLKYPLDFGASK